MDTQPQETQGRLELTPVNVTLNRPDIAELDRLARAGQTSRSQLVRRAVSDFLSEQGQQKPRRVRSDA